MYHGTKQHFVNSIVQKNLKPGNGLNAYGVGIYFSDRINVCLGYANYTQVGNKQFAVIFMSRVNPKNIIQSDEMKSINYFLVKSSEDVRPYRILLHEKK